MEYSDSNKRLKSTSGAPIVTSSPVHGAALPTLQRWQPPAPLGARGVASGPAPASARPSATIARPSNGKLKLTVKAPPSKLRQATSGSQPGGTNSIPPNPYADAPSESDATPQPAATRAQRSTRNPRTVVEPESDEDDDEDAEGEEEADEEVDADVEGDLDQELLANEDSEEDAEGEDDEELDDSMLDSHPPPPIIKQQPPPVKGCKPNVTVTAPSEGPLKSVEAKEMGMDDDDDDELSELDENDVNDMENEVDDDEDDNTDDDDPDNSRSATPDLSKLTRRQRGHFEDDVVGLMALSNEAQKKKHLTAEEHATRRAEMARRRKNLSDKRNEEEKLDTINKLLKKPAPKRRTRAEMIAAQQTEAMGGTPGAEYGEEEKPDPLFVRYVANRNGIRVGLPDEWLVAGGAAEWMARVKGGGGCGGKMVEEVA